MRQRFWQIFLTPYVPKEGVLPGTVLPGWTWTTMLIWKHFCRERYLISFLIVLVPGCSRHKFLEQAIHRHVPDIIRSLQEPRLLQGLNRHLVDRPGPQILLRFPDLLDFMARRHALYVQRAAPNHLRGWCSAVPSGRF
ncbi:hypothetical protein V1525DRAFT_12599 [Lipomyces kononenkoae]|uniref:Uncharacterized protein n=1 Tax=Lipomyces kononenkoae TaxID=34357 RepID=A0ACC3T6S8_LIPKO